MNKSKKNVKKYKTNTNKPQKQNITSIENRRRNLNNNYNRLNSQKIYTYNKTQNRNNINLDRNRQYKSVQERRIYRVTKKPKNRNIGLLSRFFTSFMLLIIVSYFVISISKGLSKKPIDYEVIEYGSIEDSIQAKGIIIRDEIVYKASKNGLLTFNKSENEKIKKGELVATIKNQENIKTEEEDIAIINEKILQLQKQRDELSVFYEDVKKIDNQIQKSLDKYIYDLSTYNMVKLYEIKDSISKKITLKNQMLLSENTTSLQELSNQKVLKEQKVNQNTENIISNDSGIVSYYTDGLEETFNFKNIDNLTKEQTLTTPKEDIPFKISVIAQENIFKIVRDNNYYIASYIPTKNISSWKQGETKTIYINDNGNLKPLEVVIEKLNIDKKESYVLMKSNKNVIDFIDKRNVVFELTKPKEGFKIKLDAISEEKLLKIPTDYITNNSVNKKSETGETVIVPIQLSGQNETGEYTYVFISKGIIDIGDYILNPKTKQLLQLNDVFTRKGIFVVNSGIYNFKNIDTEGSVQNDQFIILEPTRNSNIKLYDRYAPDLSVVKGKEMTSE